MKLTTILFDIFLLAVIILAATFYKWIFSYLISAIVLSYILSPSVSWLERKRVPRWLSVVLIYLSTAGVIVWFAYRMLPDLISQGETLMNMINSDQAPANSMLSIPIFKSLSGSVLKLDQQIPMLNLVDNFDRLIESSKVFLSSIPKLLITNYQVVLSAVSFVATIPLISFFLLKDGNKLVKDFYKIIPNRYFELSIIIINKINETVGNFLRAMFFEIIAVTIMASIALSIIGVKNSILIGLCAGVANVIPYFGPFIGTAIAITTTLIDGNTSMLPILNIIFAMYIVQVIDNNIVYPVVVGTTINMHPLIVLLTVLAGGWYGGIIWMLISVPLVYLIYSVVKVLYVNLKKFQLI
ncbi:MAG: AI-2E family transporter [Candidatus Cloacimonetes bacterium HGW-Cloacimonetes-1]|jgi:predicted PurR-regulated permease PerM|nr:MAG: AI-2E family transporter [Candidatus Cloacimonetes bacterium HGW-Cloacimonetes-1]